MKIEEAIEKTTEYLEERGYAAGGIARHRADWSKLLLYAKETTCSRSSRYVTR